MSIDIAYVAAGRLHVKFGDAAPRHIESKFASESRERLLRVEARNAWKTQGSGAQFMHGRLLWGREAKERDIAPIQVRSVTRGPRPSHVLYSLLGEQVGGLFAFDPEAVEERRIIHGVEHVYNDLALHGERGLLACSVPKRDGSAAIAMMGTDLSDYAELTEGDSIDGNPSWVPGEGRAIVFESAGIARDRSGAMVSLSPSAIQKLDVASGSLETLAEEPNVDLMQPRMSANGDLYYIRRPHLGIGKPSFWRANLDFLMFPVRLLFALLQFLNFFSTRYGGKPLTTAGSRQQKGADMRQMMAWENLMKADDAAQEPGEPKALVPASFQLVRQRGIRSETIAKSVGAYDLAEDGSIVYSTGNAVYHLDPDGRRTRICEGAAITHVVLL